MCLSYYRQASSTNVASLLRTTPHMPPPRRSPVPSDGGIRALVGGRDVLPGLLADSLPDKFGNKSLHWPGYTTATLAPNGFYMTKDVSKRKS